MNDFNIIYDKLFSYEGKSSGVTVPYGLKKVGIYAFANNQRLESVVIPESVEEIELCAFEACENLRDVEMWASVKIIGSGAFRGCRGLKQIRFHGTPQQWDAIKKDRGWNTDIGADCKIRFFY